jgi:FkbM family methyltransferase
VSPTRSHAWKGTLTAAGITVRYTRPYRPQTNGKVERFHRALRDEWEYGKAYRSENARRKALTSWLHIYNHHRPHTALGAKPPITRATNLPGQNIYYSIYIWRKTFRITSYSLQQTWNRLCHALNMSQIVGHINGHKVTVETEGDPYGPGFWHKVFLFQYEPTTQGLIHGIVDSQSTFIDLGAATGSMTLTAAALGAQVHSYEASPSHHQILERNASLNPHLPGSIETHNCAVGARQGNIQFKLDADSSLLSPIVFHGLEPSAEQIPIQPLSHIISRHSGDDSNLVIKMDVEGAEYSILRDTSNLATLFDSNATLILAIHPGLASPPKSRSLPRRLSWRLRNMLRDLRLFEDLHGTDIRFVGGGNRVRRWTGPVASQIGIHEYIVRFRTNRANC